MRFQTRIDKRWSNVRRRPSRFGSLSGFESFLAAVGVAIAAIVAICLTFPYQSIAAQNKTPENAARGFMAGSYRSQSGEGMPYRLFVPPGYEPSYKYPIILWLHGAAGSGSDNISQLTGGNYPGSHLWTTPENQAAYHAFVLAPQVDASKGWARPHTSTPPVAIRLALEILATVEQKYSIDRAREYLAGQSMGGEGVWAALSIAPERFAAAIALCGYGDGYMIARVAEVPVWIFQGEEDPTVPVSRARMWAADLRKAGGNPKYTEYPSIGHNVWDVAFSEPGLAKWLFLQARN
ncbi:MAG: alpha/beta hydrolase-fold protein [Candidatus Acidiferrales bacterium]